MKVVFKFKTDTIESELTIVENFSVVVGRTNQSSYTIADELLSGVHCKISLLPHKLEAIDLGSKNGTYLNGLRIEQAELFLGDELRIGKTTVQICADKMDTNSINALTFPGHSRDRQSHGLQLDFNGARMINQGLVASNPNQSKPTISSNTELEVRKKVHSKIRLSKQEINLRNKARSSFASTLDIIFTFASIAFPLIIINVFTFLDLPITQNNRLPIIGVSVVLSLAFFTFFNFKIFKFTIGEKISGIEKIYSNQEDKF